MSLRLLMFVMVGLIGAPAFAADLNCRAADDGNRNRQSVAVTVLEGNEFVDPIITTYAGYDVTVVYNKGDQFEPQTLLTISADEYAARTYNVSQDGLYQLLAPGLFLQCWFE